MSQKMAAAALLAVMAAVAAAQEITPSTGKQESGREQKTAFLKENFPFEGEVTVDRLNVRLFARADGGGIIATVLSQGEKVVVTAEKDEFFEIQPPRGTSVWIFGRNVKREGDDTGLVIVNDAPVRLDSRNNAEKLAVLTEGTKVRILREHMGWFQIAAPAAVKYFVSKKYVKATGKGIETATPAAPSADAEAFARMKEADEMAAEQKALLAARQIKDLDFGRVAEAYESVAALFKNEDSRKEAQAQARLFRQMQTLYVMVDKQLGDSEKKLEELKKAIEDKNRIDAPKWDFTGYLDTVGPLWNRPGAHKLIMGDKIVTFLKSGDEDMRLRLNSFFGKYVGVKGTIQKDPEGWTGYTVVIVESIEEVRR